MFSFIHIHNLRVPTIIGVEDFEKSTPQDVIIDLKLTLDIHAAAEHDDLACTVNYKSLHDNVVAYVSSATTLLIEKLAYEVAKLCMAQSDRVTHVDVKISKPQALPGEAIAAVSLISPFEKGGGGNFMQELFHQIGEDPSREGLAKTPERVFQTFKDLTVGYKQKLEDVLAGSVIEDSLSSHQQITLSDIEFYSLCEHHLLPFFGMVQVSYTPNKKIIGIGTLVKIVHLYAKRLQIQERLTKQIADALKAALDPLDVDVRIEATHMCMAMRSMGTQGARLRTRSASRLEELGG